MANSTLSGSLGLNNLDDYKLLNLMQENITLISSPSTLPKSGPVFRVERGKKSILNDLRSLNKWLVLHKFKFRSMILILP